ncbi:MAG: hypothetical protein K8R59_02475 [Thermoanaerobaculales bacterium]|nr:hypothetical protein [Thermoanaerobaculales bacterium]
MMMRLGYEAFEILDFGAAKVVFEDLAARFADVEAEGAEGCEVAERWQEVFLQAEGLEPRERASQLWTALENDPIGPGEARTSLRIGVAGFLVDLLTQHGIDFVPPDLSIGRLHLESGRLVEARSWVEAALDRKPEDIRLQRFYGDVLWASDLRLKARERYAYILLMDPDATPLEGLPDSALAGVISAHGREMAPVYGWLARVLPLVDDPGFPDTVAVRATRVLGAAEDARRNRRHSEMVDIRTRLKEDLPEIFDAYMQRLGIGGRL